jgi:hypothetical protein
MNPLEDPEAMIATIARICEIDRQTTAAEVLRDCAVEIEQTDYDNWDGGTYTHGIHLGVSPELYGKILSEVGNVEDVILKHARAQIRHVPNHHIGQVIIVADGTRSRENACQIFSADLLNDIEAQRNIMIAVSTGGPLIKTVDPEYIFRRHKIKNGLDERRIEDPNPFDNLWAWYGKWSSGDLPSYQSRRQFIWDLYAPLMDQLRLEAAGRVRVREVEPTGWAKVDRVLHEIRQRLAEATVEEQFQAVGLLCREALISLAQTVFDPEQHPTLDGIAASKTDAQRMLEAYIAKTLSGSVNESARRHAKAALVLTNDLQHKRTATFRDAALCAEATTSVVNLIAIISGQRDP